MKPTLNRSLALRWPVLSQSHFHWFLGLTYTKNKYKNSLGAQATTLLGNKNAHKKMTAKQKELHNYNPVVRWFYLLFNIEIIRQMIISF